VKAFKKLDASHIASADNLRWISEPIVLGGPSPHPQFSKAYGVAQPLAELIVQKFAPPKAEISAFRLGNLAVLGVPGEPTSALGMQIRAYGMTKGFALTLVVAHVNGWMGYVLAKDDYRKGGYEATLSFFGEDSGPRLVEAAKRALDSLGSPELTVPTNLR